MNFRWGLLGPPERRERHLGPPERDAEGGLLEGRTTRSTATTIASVSKSSSSAAPSPADVAEATAIPVLEYGRAWMMAKPTHARAEELGLTPGFGFWVNGRAGALGEVSADVAAAAIGFMAPDLVQELWHSRPSDVTPLRAALEYGAMAAEWGRETLAEMDEARIERLIDLSDKVIAGALPICGAIFAGWRGLDRPDDPAGNATFALQILREMRGGAHLSAIQSAGLSPQHAILSFTADPIRGSAAGAERFGWQAPHPAPDEAARARAETMTTNVCMHAYEALDEGERGEFIELVLEARAQFEA